MSDATFHVGNAAKNYQDSPSFQPFSMVRIIVGEDESGNQLVYEAGEDSGRVLEVTNPWGTQQMADDMLNRIFGYEYKPYTADGALIDPAAELGDAVTVGTGDDMVYSVINSAETTISPLMSATISARESSNIEHEYPYEDKQSREITRKVNGLRTSFTVELGKIEATITDEVNGLSSRITQTANTIESEIRNRESADSEMSSRIEQTDSKIDLEVSRATAAEGNLSSSIEQTADSITSEVNRAKGVEESLASRITQTASDIRAEVSGIYADEWTIGTGVGSEYFYNPGDVVKVTSGDTVTYYKCIEQHDSTTNYKPGSGRYWEDYWEQITPTSVQSMVDIGVEGITLSYEASDMENSATIVLNREGIQMQATTITMTNVVADTIKARASIESPKIYGGTFYNEDGTARLVVGEDLTFYGSHTTGKLFEIYDEIGTVDLKAYNRTFLSYDSSNNKVWAFGTWDFSNATVIGI